MAETKKKKENREPRNRINYKSKKKPVKQNYTKRAPKENSRKRNNETPLRIIPLGGLEEIGKNITLFEY